MHPIGQARSTREINLKCLENLGREARREGNLFLQNYLNVSPENKKKRSQILCMFHTVSVGR
jgi:hypothetical protein